MYLLVCQYMERSTHDLIDWLRVLAVLALDDGEPNVHASVRERKLTWPGRFRLRFTIGLTPVSFGSSRTNENPSFRCRNISSASSCNSGSQSWNRIPPTTLIPALASEMSWHTISQLEACKACPNRLVWNRALCCEKRQTLSRRN